MKKQSYILFTICAASVLSISAFAAGPRPARPVPAPLYGVVGITHHSGCPGTIPVCPDGMNCPPVECVPYSEIELVVPTLAGCSQVESNYAVKVKAAAHSQQLAISKLASSCDPSPGSRFPITQNLMIRTDALDSSKPVQLQNSLLIKEAPLPQ